MTAEATTEEQKAFDKRRAAEGVDAKLPAYGLALSGGGIRSATFCVGLIRALAANGVLRRFDYLSTVSGGGYAGAALGRLYRPGTRVADIEKGLASDGSLWLWWLRSNGRFLIPAGTRDLLQAAAFQLRGFLATQLEAAIIALLVAAIIILPHVLIQTFGLPLAARGWLQAGGTLWWAVLPLPVLGGLIAITAYWFSRDGGDGMGWRDAVLAAVILAVSVWLISRLQGMDTTADGARMQLIVLAAAAGVLLCVPLGYLLRLARSKPAAEDRIVYTGWLASAMAWFAAILVFGFADLSTWLAAWLWIRGDELKLSGAGGVAVLLIIIARAVLPALEKLQRSSAGSLPLDRIANIVGLVLLALLALLWLTLLQALVFLAGDGPALKAVFGDHSDSALARWGAVFAVIALYGLVTRRNLQQLNRSSLHEFYRSRLARTYVSVGNYADRPPRGPGQRFPAPPLVGANRALSKATERVTRLLAGDDVRLADYRPYDAGGPIHLVNCCINQTRDDRTGNFNADRKGIALTVSALGLETGTHRPVPIRALADVPLSRWVAISGAAASTGMGSLTRPGTSALLFLSGLRLGYWWQRQKHRTWSKYRAALAEMLARFPGMRSRAWYLSDGGHFDNTGVYALLKRKVPVIVLADCGADPRFLFSDLENLVRKARIDYSANIDFVDPAAIPDLAVARLLGTPDTIGPEPGDAFLLLARICYSGGGTGALLVVKPRRLPELPLDVIGYADRDPLFPQQTTADQFFDEEQWESYQALGRLLGGEITPSMLDRLPEWAASAEVIDIGSVTPTAKDVVPTPVTRRQRVVATVGTSIGVGAVASVLLAGWQLWDERNRLEAERQRAFLEAAGKMADAMANAKQGFTPEIKLRLDSLVSLAAAPSGAEASRRQILSTVADSLAPLCASEKDTGQCQNYLRVLRGESIGEGPLQLALNDYWVYRTGTTTAVAVVVPPPVASAPVTPPVSQPAAQPEAKSDEGKMSRATKGKPPIDLPAPSAKAPAPPEPPQAAPVQQAPAQQRPVLAWTRAACSAGKSALSLYIHIYGEDEREAAKEIAEQAIQAGMVVPRIDNVIASAQRDSKAPPVRWRTTTWLYRGEDGLRCANAARQWLQSGAKAQRPSQVVELPAALRAPAGVIELWLTTPASAR